MTKQTEALRMAIEAFEPEESTWWSHTKMAKAYQACKDALAETQEASEQAPCEQPVAWMNDIAFSMDKELLGTRSRIVPLYTTPPSREWVGLSDEEITHIGISCQSLHQVARAISEDLREKNV